jgi:hypothetical protein
MQGIGFHSDHETRAPILEASTGSLWPGTSGGTISSLELIPLPLSGSIPELPHVATVFLHRPTEISRTVCAAIEQSFEGLHNRR